MAFINSRFTFGHLLTIFIIIVSSIGRSLPPRCLSEGKIGSKLLIYGRPLKCFEAGSRGPCQTNEILLPRDETSSRGICMLTTATTTSLEKLQRVKDDQVENVLLGNQLTIAGIRPKYTHHRLQSPYFWTTQNRKNGVFLVNVENK